MISERFLIWAINAWTFAIDEQEGLGNDFLNIRCTMANTGLILGQQNWLYNGYQCSTMVKGGRSSLLVDEVITRNCCIHGGLPLKMLEFSPLTSTWDGTELLRVHGLCLTVEKASWEWFPLYALVAQHRTKTAAPEFRFHLDAQGARGER